MKHYEISLWTKIETSRWLRTLAPGYIVKDNRNKTLKKYLQSHFPYSIIHKSQGIRTISVKKKKILTCVTHELNWKALYWVRYAKQRFNINTVEIIYMWHLLTNRILFINTNISWNYIVIVEQRGLNWKVRINKNSKYWDQSYSTAGKAYAWHETEQGSIPKHPSHMVLWPVSGVIFEFRANSKPWVRNGKKWPKFSRKE